MRIFLVALPITSSVVRSQAFAKFGSMSQMGWAADVDEIRKKECGERLRAVCLLAFAVLAAIKSKYHSRNCSPRNRHNKHSMKARPQVQTDSAGEMVSLGPAKPVNVRPQIQTDSLGEMASLRPANPLQPEIHRSSICMFSMDMRRAGQRRGSPIVSRGQMTS